MASMARRVSLVPASVTRVIIFPLRNLSLQQYFIVVVSNLLLLNVGFSL